MRYNSAAAVNRGQQATPTFIYGLADADRIGAREIR
jgi:hypothetical protein